MQFHQALSAAGSSRRCSSADRVMWITPDRVFYVGLLGAPSERTMGAITVYVSLDQPVRLCLAGGDWQSADVAVVQPYVPHRVACDARHIAVLKIEPETVDLARLPELLKSPSGPVAAPAFAEHVRRCHQQLLLSGKNAAAAFPDFDELLFSGPLPGRSMDARIATVLEDIRRDPAGQAVAQDCAEQVHLSFSRFLHLFKSEVGAPFRSFRTWKRARSLLHYVDNQNSTLTDVALDAGYPDSTHFSHSIRQVYGLKPRDIFAGSRKLRVIVPATAPSAAYIHQ